jgi:hypothetical protein
LAFLRHLLFILPKPRRVGRPPMSEIGILQQLSLSIGADYSRNAVGTLEWV